MDQLTPFGRMVRKIRIDRAIRLSEMADHMRVTPAFICSVEMGRVKIPEGWGKKITDFFQLSPTSEKELQEIINQARI
ncbi:MAG: helix-turn-helix transcriptional regulator [Magnetococcales bacterium]|nr:helix-turn-helix transcriptional regulator [Magnetococcales bacterium]